MEYRSRLKRSLSRRHRDHSNLEVSVDFRSRADFMISKEDEFDRFAKKIKLVEEMQTGDAIFDDRFYLTTDSPKFVAQLLSKDEVRTLVTELFDMEFDQLNYDGRVLTVRRPNIVRGMAGLDEISAEAGKRLVKIKGILPGLPQPASLSIRRFLRFFSSLTAWIILFIAFAVMLYGLLEFKPLFTTPSFVYSLLFSLPALVLFLVLHASLFRGRSDAHRILVAVFAPSFFSFPLLGWGVVLVTNGYYDSSPVTEQIGEIVSHHRRKSKNRFHYSVEVALPEFKNKLATFEISKSAFDRVYDGHSRMIVLTKPGYLGFPWIVSQKFEA